MSDNPQEQPAGLVGLPKPRMIGRYTVVKTLGRGGMGQVFKALDSERNRFVALKILDEHSSDDPEVLKRFEREARSAITLDHPNIAKMYGIEYDAHREPFITMEFIDGEALDQFLDKRTDLAFSQIVDFIIQAARGLEAAARRSIIHRDIKPANLLVTATLQIRIIDFGLAKSMWESSFITGSGMVVGTPRYISPEQALGKTVDHRSDIYSLGATFYELVTRQTPFDGDTAMAIMLKHINAQLVPPYMINPKVPGDVNEIICKMMAKDPADRYQDYEPLIRDLESAKIHRLAKERRASDADLPAVAVAQENDTLVRAKSPYVSEGIVDVQFDEDAHAVPAHSRSRMILYSLLGIAILGVAAFGLMQAKGRSGEPTGRTIIGQLIANMLGENEKPVGPTPEERAAKDLEKLNFTIQRMQATVDAITEYRKQPGTRGAIPRIVDLRSKNVLSIDDTRDGWGNDFSVNRGTGQLIAPGRDGLENTPDDFVMSLSGTMIKRPQPLTAADFPEPKQ